MSLSRPTVDKALLKKVAWRLLPMLMILYFMNYLDKVNVGFAALTMNADLGLSATAYGLGAGLFFVGYFIFEVPSNILLTKFGARVWITRIVVTWGIIAGAMGFIQDQWSFYILRFLLGVAEAGFFPGIVFFLGMWFPRLQRARILAFVYAAVPVSILLGSPLSALFIEYGHGLAGLEGWRIMFLAEGIMTVIAGAVGFFILVDKPAKAKWLTPSEREALTAVIEAEDAAVAATQKTHSMKAAFSPRVLVLAVIYFGVAYGLYAVSFFLPQVIDGFQAQYGITFDMLGIALITAIPYAFAVVAMLVWSRHSDKKAERYLHLAVSATLGGIAIAVSLVLGSPVLTMIGITVTAIGIFCSVPVFWQIPPTFLTGATAAAAIGVINSIGNLSGFFAPYITGYFRDTTGSFQPGMLFAAGFMVLSGILALVIRAQARRREGLSNEVKSVQEKTSPLASRS